MRANIRSVSSTDETFFERIASAARKAVAKSSSFADAPDALAAFGSDGEELCKAGFDVAAALSGKTLEAGNAVAARASGTVLRKSRRFICGMVNGEAGGCNLLCQAGLFYDSRIIRHMY
jgi:hypothetical protein